jgi:hypothetical protein
MPYLTLDQARAASGLAGRTFLAEQELRKSASTPRSQRFDVFLSHSRLDADVIVGVKTLIEAGGLSVYVDWIEDPQLDRRNVTPATADALRGRMRTSETMVFATSESSPASKWMPWELGFFDGQKPGHIGILALVRQAGAQFRGQEYIGLYPVIEDVSDLPRRPRLGIRTGGTGVRTETHPLGALKTQGFTVRG